MNKRLFLIGARLFFAALNIAAIVVQLLYSSQYALSFNALNFFSYFTILSNVFVSVVFVISAFYLAVGRKPSPAEDILRGASVLYMAVTGIIYATLLANIDVDLTLPWVNMQLHYIMPIVVILDWLYQPQRSVLNTKRIVPWLFFPALYLIYVLIRGAIVNWYPYPFLNPALAGGYLGVTLYGVGILVTLLIVSLTLMKLGNSLKRQVS
jgi:hypothetical protein